MAVRSFEIIEQIAHGGMAEVFRARTLGVEGFQKEVCIKRMLARRTCTLQFDFFLEMPETSLCTASIHVSSSVQYLHAAISVRRVSVMPFLEA